MYMRNHRIQTDVSLKNSRTEIGAGISYLFPTVCYLCLLNLQQTPKNTKKTDILRKSQIVLLENKFIKKKMLKLYSYHLDAFFC